MGGPYFIWTTKRRATSSQAAEIQRRCQKVLDDVTYVSHNAPGNDTHGWLERPNDGCNDYNSFRAGFRECIAIAQEVLGIEVATQG